MIWITRQLKRDIMPKSIKITNNGSIASEDQNPKSNQSTYNQTIKTIKKTHIIKHDID